MSSFYQNVEEKVDETLVDLKDFRRYHIHKLDMNDRRYSYEVKKLTNERYETFEKMMEKFVNQDNKIQTAKLSLLWMLFDESSEILSYHKHLDELRRTDKSQVLKWIKIVEHSTVQELFPYGVNVASSVYGMIIDYYREWMITQKYDRIYSKGTTIDEWFEEAQKHLPLMKGEEIPFDIQMVSEKLKTLISVAR